MKDTAKKIFQKLITVILIIAMLSSYFPMLVLANNEETEGTQNYITFDVNWKNVDGVNITDGILKGETESSYVFQYNLKFNGTGFNNVVLTIKDSETTLPIQITTNGVTGSYSRVELGNQNSGTEIKNEESVIFKKNDKEYIKEVVFRLEASYIDPIDGETKQYVSEKRLKAEIIPKTETTYFNGTIDMQKDKNNIYKNTQISKEKEDLGLNNYNRDLGWYAKKITTTYPIHVEAYTHTQKLELVVTINRISSKNSMLEHGYEIDWGGLDDKLGTPEKVHIDNGDGSVTYKFTKGSDADTLVKENTFSINDDFNVTITYQTANSNPTQGGTINEYSTKCLFRAELKATGFMLEKEYGKEEVVKDQKINDSLNKEDTVSLAVYTPGNHAWVDLDLGARDSSYLEKEDIQNFIDDRTIDLPFLATINNEHNWGEKDERNGYVHLATPQITYLSDEGDIVKRELTTDEIRLKTITPSGYLRRSSIKIGEQDIDFNEQYNIAEGTNINAYTITMKNFLLERFENYELIYTLNADELGLSEAELENILTISIDLSTSGDWCNGHDTGTYYNTNSLGNKYSYMEVDTQNFDYSTKVTNTKIEIKTLRLRMFKNEDVIRTKEISVVNENPVFYVQLPSMFTYSDFEIKSNNTQISIAKLGKVITPNKEQYLVIQCEGIYDSSVIDEIDIIVTYKRKLKSGSSIGREYMNVYMLTDNERYYKESSNSLEFKKGEELPEKIMRTQLGFEISSENIIQARTKIKDKFGNSYIPNPVNEDVERTEIEEPLIMGKDDKITVFSELECQGDTLSKISILSRLPKANNTDIYDTNLKLIADGYQLPDKFFEKFKNSINSLQKGDEITQIDLQNIQNLQVYMIKNSKETILDTSKYTIYYTSIADVTIDTDISEYQVYTEGTDLSQAKNIKVVFADDVKLAAGQRIGLKYEATMPDEVGMSAVTTAAEYTKLDGGITSLYPPAAYVINGSTNGNLEVTKKFQGYDLGVAPSKISLEGIEFKLKYYDENTNEIKFLQDENGNDIVESTDATGVATFSNVPVGEYNIHEVTTFERFEEIGDLAVVNITPGETVKYTYENKIKKGDIIINKLWEDTDIQQGPVTFKLEKQATTGENIPYDTIYVTTNEQGVAIAKSIPYGVYYLTEYKTIDGWRSTRKTIFLQTETYEVTVTNTLSKGILQIEKTVPEKETVDGLKFHITGISKVNYINKNGEEVSNNTDLTVTIGEDYSTNPNIIVEKPENDTKAIITIKNLPLGYYYVEEIEMPVIDVDGTNIEKYVTASAETELKVHDLKNPVTVKIKNQYKYGYIQINKTAKLKEGDTYTDIGDLSQFKVRITGTSYYGNTVDKTIQLDEDGKAFTKVEIGKYTITEVAKEGYTTYYGEDAAASTTPPEVTVDYNKTTIQKLYNEHTGVGYVRVEKTLEGVTNPETVKDAKIKFVVVGKNVAGGSVESEIEIDQIDIVKNVAYGVSEAISAGGEYELREVESTIPSFYEGIEPVVVDIKTAHTQEAPLVINAVDPRTKGNLEIITKTYPEGGPLFGITYRVTEVKINQDGTYTKIGTAKELAGNNDLINTSFAEIKDMYAGYYLVEQLTVPDGWIMDLPQIVEVPSYNTGYATFEITKKEKLKENKVTINKVILNSNNEVATAEEIAKAKLNEKESFEIKIKNVDTQEEYYAFASTEKPGIIQGIDAGTYTIEEVYKPKYTTEGYYNHITVAPNGDLANLNVPGEVIEEKIAETDGKYLFTITEDENGVAQNVTLTVKNKINTNFGFGGQDRADNYSLVDYEEQQIQIVTKAVIYVVDEENNAISGAKFKLVNEEGSIVSYGNKTEFEVNDKKLTIRGLDVGKYTLVCTAYPDGYLKPDDKVITVYSDAVEVARVEIQKNVPRGSLMLSTVYKTDEGEQKYTSRSKYKVVNKDTGELLTFQRTATGDYKKSNLPDASPVILLKSGAVEVEGIEIGNYEVGIVDVTKGYGIQKTLPEDVTVVENDTQNVSVEVVKKTITQVETGQDVTMYLNENGELYIIGKSYYGLFGNGNTSGYGESQFVKIEFPEGTKIKNFSVCNLSAMAIDTEGRVWSWGSNSSQLGTGNTSTIYTPICITDTTLAEEYNNGIRFVDVEVGFGISILIDNEGKVWTCGNYIGNGNSNTVNVPVCITDLENDLHEEYEKGVKIEKTAIMNGYSIDDNRGFIDSLGRIWMWDGSENYSPICISETTDLKDIKIEQLVLADNYTMALDNEGNVWLWGNNESILKDVVNGVQTFPTKIDSSYFGSSKIKIIDGGYTNAIVVDEFGKVWTWGSSDLLGTQSITSTSTPICISDEETEALYGKQIDLLAINDYSSRNVIATDKNSCLWTWGYDDSIAYRTYGQTKNPKLISYAYNEHLEYNVKFKSVEVYNNKVYAIDEEGQLWVWGYQSSYYELGLGNYYGNYYMTPIKLELPGNPKIKKVISAGGYGAIALSEDGRIYSWGDLQIYDGSETGVIERTDEFNLDDNTIIIDVDTDRNYSLWAIDSEGKVYKCLNNTIECISDDDSEALKGVNIVKLDVDVNSNATAIDDKGEIYYWNASSYGTGPKKYESNLDVKFVDVLGGYLLDDTGKLWTFRSNSELICRSERIYNPLYKNYQIDSEYKILDIYKPDSLYAAILKDSNGDLWYYKNNNTDDVIKLEGEISINSYTVKTDLMPKEIISLSEYLLVDKYGQIWVYQNISNSYGEAGIGTTNSITEPICLTNPEAILNNEPVFKANNTVINVPQDNELNGIKIKELVNDYFAIDENDNIWYFTSSGKAINLTTTYKGYENPLYGKEIIEVIGSDYVVTSDNKVYYVGGGYPGYVMDLMSEECEYIVKSFEVGKEYYIALDKNGNVWSCGTNTSGYLGNGGYTTNSKPVCLNDIEGTELYEAQQNDADFKIENVYTIKYTGNSNLKLIAAIDNSGRLWAWGSAYCADGTSNKHLSPVCINNIEETDFHNAYIADNSLRIEKIDDCPINNTSWCATDSTGEIWYYDTSTKTLKRFSEDLATGDLKDAFENEEGFTITKFIDSGYYDSLYCMGNNGKLYHRNAVTGTYSAITNLNNVQDMYYSYYTYSSSGNYEYYRYYYWVKTTDGMYKLEEYVRDYKYSINTHSTTPTKVSVANLKEIVYCEGTGGSSASSLLVLDTDGNLWISGKYTKYFGYATFSTSSTASFKNITNDSTHALYGKQIEHIEKVGTTMYATDVDGNIYAWCGISGETVPTLYTKHDEIVTQIYGEATNENRIKLIKKMSSNSALEQTENGIFKLEFANSQLTCTQESYTDKYIGSIGNITEVVGEYEVKTEDGKTYKLTPTSTTEYTIEEVTTETPVSKYEGEEIKIDGANIVKQTKYKALDDNGKLYVWGNYTGISQVFDGVLCLTDEQYYIAPIYSKTNGWSVIKNQF